MNHDLQNAQNMKSVLLAFEQLLDLKINFHKSELYCFGEALEYREQYNQLFGCQVGNFPFRYLGISIHYRKLRNAEWREVVERFLKKLSSWKGKLLSLGGRLTLINSVLSSLPMYMMSFLAIPSGVRKKLDYFRSRFYWQGDGHKKKYRLAKWDIIRRPKDQGGLGIHDLDVKNIVLLSKWLYKLLTTDGMWQQMLRNKYLGTQPLSQTFWKAGDSHFWTSLMKVKQDFLRFGSFRIRDGSQIRFWEDKWLGNASLRDQFPCLYNIVRHKHSTISQIFQNKPPSFSWRRDLTGAKLAAWHNLWPRIADLVLTQEQDEFRWNLTPNGVFSVNSLYLALVHTGIPNINRRIWKIKVPLKVKIFLWYLRRGVTLTKDNLVKRKWKGSKKCCFCPKNETIQHLLFQCHLTRLVWSVIHLAYNLQPPQNMTHMFGRWFICVPKDMRNLVLMGATALCWSIWLSRNGVIFYNKMVSSPLQVITLVTRWLRT